MSPSTAWKETVVPNETNVFEDLAQQLGALQKARAASGGMHRALHAKQNVAAHATFEVHGQLAPHARVGLFSEPKTYQALVRFSNGGGAVQPDKRPDVRGIGVKVLGVGGKKLIPGMEAAPTQDFLGILSPAVPFRTPEEFVWVVVNSANQLTFLPKALLHLGLGRAGKLLTTLQKGLSQPIHSLAANRYFSALPLRFGDSAVKFSFTPNNGPATDARPDDLGAELAGRLANGPLAWDFGVQFFEDEHRTPIEDPTVEWKTPFETLATLRLPQQDVRGERGAKLLQWTESLSFDPWHSQEELRPLGAMMRARSPAYRVSNQLRGAAGEPAAIPPELVG